MRVELRDVWFTYDRRRWALKGISVVLDDRRLVILGPNASGKSTLMKVAAILLKPVRGSVLVDGQDVWALSERERLRVRRRIMYVHERPLLIRGRVIDNLMYPLLVRGLSRERARARAEEVARELGISHLLERKREQLSAGEKQLVCIARALTVEPDVLMLDEPTANLDVVRREEVVRVLRRYDGKVVIATHDMTLATELAGKVIVMSEGHIVAEARQPGSVDAIYRLVREALCRSSCQSSCCASE